MQFKPSEVYFEPLIDNFFECIFQVIFVLLKRFTKKKKKQMSHSYSVLHCFSLIGIYYYIITLENFIFFT